MKNIRLFGIGMFVASAATIAWIGAMILGSDDSNQAVHDFVYQVTLIKNQDSMKKTVTPERPRASLDAGTNSILPEAVNPNAQPSIVQNTKLEGDFFAGLPALDDAVSQYEELSVTALQGKLNETLDRLNREHWIERANRNQLSDAQMRELAYLMHQESSIRLSLITRQLDELEEDVL